jgi:hypothetical protein
MDRLGFARCFNLTQSIVSGSFPRRAVMYGGSNVVAAVLVTGEGSVPQRPLCALVKATGTHGRGGHVGTKAGLELFFFGGGGRLPLMGIDARSLAVYRPHLPRSLIYNS